MSLKREQIANLKAVVQSNRLSFYTAGSGSSGFVEEFEELAKEYFNIPYAIALSSGTAGLHIAATLVGYRWQKVIYVPAVSFSASASCAYMAHKIPEFVDIETDNYCINFSQLKPTIDHHAAVIAVHLHGHPADMDKCPNIPLIEDCAQAIGAEYHGRKVGTIGKCGIFSFNWHKQIQCGEGGLFITADEELARNARLMANHGEVCSDILGHNYRMTELQAAVLIPQLKRLDEIINRRRELAHRLTDKIKNIEGLTPPIERENCRHSYCTYPVRVAENINRDELQAALLKDGVYFGKGGYKPLHMFPFYRGMRKYNLPNAEWAYEHIMYTNVIKNDTTYKEMDRIAKVLQRGIVRAQNDKRGR